MQSRCSATFATVLLSVESLEDGLGKLKSCFCPQKTTLPKTIQPLARRRQALCGCTVQWFHLMMKHCQQLMAFATPNSKVFAPTSCHSMSQGQCDFISSSPSLTGGKAVTVVKYPRRSQIKGCLGGSGFRPHPHEPYPEGS